MGRIPHLPAQHQRVRIALVTPAPAEVHTGNRTTADRWARLLGELGNHVNVGKDWNGEECDLLIALHARRSSPAIQRFRQERPHAPIIVALTGTDLYGDLENSAEAICSLELASRIVVLQALGVEAVHESARRKVRVIYQSAERPSPPPRREESCFQVCVLAHLRAVKDPLRPAYAVRELPASSRIQVKHAGAVAEPTSSAKQSQHPYRSFRRSYRARLVSWEPTIRDTFPSATALPFGSNCSARNPTTGFIATSNYGSQGCTHW